MKIKAWLQRDGIVIVLFAITSLLMSYPLVSKLGGDWLASRDPDTFVKIWDNWWLQTHAFHERSLFFTNLEFHPTGLDLSYHSISWTVAFLSWALAQFTDAITAYNLTILIALFATAYAAYLLVEPFAHYRAAAWLAGAIYSFAPYHVAHSGGHPDLVHLAPIPIAVLLLFKGLTKPSTVAALGAALMLALAAFTSLYIMVFALLTIGPVAVFILLDKRRWTQTKVWQTVIVFTLVSAFLLGVRLVPIFRSTDALTEAIELKYTAAANQTDLLSFFLPSHLNPIFAPYTKEIASRLGSMGGKWPAYLGIVPLALTISALTWKVHRRIVLPWFLIGLLFFILSLGPVLRFNGHLYENTVLPARYLAWFPPIRSVGRPNFFVLGVLLPLAVLAAFGLDRLLIRLEEHRIIQAVLMIVLPGLLLVEYWSGEFPGVSSNVNPFYHQLAHESEDFAIIQLPMGRYNSKRYLFFQTVHHKAIIEGLSARTPTEAYQYLQSNPLLLRWFNGEPLNCSTSSHPQIMSALNELIDDDFRYVIVHHKESKIPVQFADYFSFEPIYQDDYLTAYELADLRRQPTCGDVYERVWDLPSREIPTSISWDRKISLLGYDLPKIDPESGILSITVYWQATKEMENSYISFFHLVDEESGSLVSQADVIPRGWSYPTSWWMTGEVVEDTVQIPTEDVPPGRYELYLGWYDEKTGMRLPIGSEQEVPLTDGSTLLTVIRK